MSKEKKFVSGLFVKKPHQKAPEFVKMAISIKREDLINFLNSEQDEWINIDVKESRKGSLYAEVNTFKPQKQTPQQHPQQQTVNQDVTVENVPF